MVCRGVPGGVATEVASGCWWSLRPLRGCRGVLCSSVRGGLASGWCCGWCFRVARRKGSWGGWWRGPPPFLHADFLWGVNPWNARSLNKSTQGRLRATVGVCAHLHEAKLVNPNNTKTRINPLRTIKLSENRTRMSHTHLIRPACPYKGSLQPQIAACERREASIPCKAAGIN